MKNSPDVQHGIEFQRLVIDDMRKNDLTIFACVEPDTGEHLSLGKFFDRYSMTLQLLDELERKHDSRRV